MCLYIVLTLQDHFRKLGGGSLCTINHGLSGILCPHLLLIQIFLLHPVQGVHCILGKARIKEVLLRVGTLFMRLQECLLFCGIDLLLLLLHIGLTLPLKDRRKDHLTGGFQHRLCPAAHHDQLPLLLIRLGKIRFFDHIRSILLNDHGKFAVLPCIRISDLILIRDSICMILQIVKCLFEILQLSRRSEGNLLHIIGEVIIYVREQTQTHIEAGIID